MNIISIILFAIIGSTIHAGAGYWITYGIGTLLYGIGIIIKACED